jgi:hypothetical protein
MPTRGRALGFCEEIGPDGRREWETFTCCHCSAIVDVPPPTAPEVGFCRLCFSRECLDCARKDKCIPFERKLEAMEARGRLLAAISGG